KTFHRPKRVTSNRESRGGWTRRTGPCQLIDLDTPKLPLRYPSESKNRSTLRLPSLVQTEEKNGSRNCLFCACVCVCVCVLERDSVELRPHTALLTEQQVKEMHIDLPKIQKSSVAKKEKEKMA